jgi:Fur family peroxide stress response transcriptional regulator
MLVAHDRTTKYITAVRDCMNRMGHATNADILTELRGEFPDLSATTVHRITTRMVERGELQLAPSGQENVMRFDANLAPHDHFMCEHCGLLKDAELNGTLGPIIEKAIGDGCSISGSLTVSGTCKSCHNISTI